jgi:hypothetical protein
MRLSIRTIVLALPLALALTVGAGVAANAVVPFEPDAPAPVPWAPFEQEDPEDDSPVADVPWAPFEQDEGPGPDLPEGQPETDDDDIDPGPDLDDELEPAPSTDTVPDPQAAPVVEPRPVDSGTGKLAGEAVDDTATADDLRATGSPLIPVLIGLGLLLTGLSIAASIMAVVAGRRSPARH